jgi:dTDP-4-dehydrorhamnose reductase
MLRLADTRDQVRVVSDQIGSPTYTKDLAETVIQLFDSPPGTYHAANAGVCSWYEFAKAIMEESGRKTAVLPVSTEEYGNLTPRPAYSVLSLESIEKLGLGMRHWRDALRDYLQGEGQCK